MSTTYPGGNRAYRKMMTNKCAICQAIETKEIQEGGIYIGLYEDINENRCHICQAQIIEDITNLSERQSQVEALRQQGKTYKEIATILGIEKNTVETHLEKIRNKKRNARQTLEYLDP